MLNSFITVRRGGAVTVRHAPPARDVRFIFVIRHKGLLKCGKRVSTIFAVFKLEKGLRVSGRTQRR